MCMRGVMGLNDGVAIVQFVICVEFGSCKDRCLLEIFECLKLTRGFTVPCLCDCRVIWRLVLLGAEQQRAGARAFRAGSGVWGDGVWAEY